jgi:hypothetical protein
MTAGATRLGSFVVFVVVLLTPAQTSLLERAAIVPERAADPAAGCIQSRKMKAVFLDIDGVLLPFGEPPTSVSEDAADIQHDGVGSDVSEGRFPERCLQALSRLLRETGAEVVLLRLFRVPHFFARGLSPGSHCLGRVLLRFSSAGALLDVALCRGG